MSDISLTKKQYLELLKAADAYAMAQEALNECEGKELKGEEYELRNYLLTFAPKFDLEKSDPKRAKPDWTDELAEDSFEVISEYAEMEMWHILAWRLATIEYERKRKKSNDSHDDRFMKISEIYDKILDEFVENGLENVKIKGTIE